MAPKRKSDQVDLDLTVADSVDENSQAVAPKKRARKSDTIGDPSAASSAETKGKEKSTKPESWREVNLDGEDEVRNLITRIQLSRLLTVNAPRIYREAFQCSEIIFKLLPSFRTHTISVTTALRSGER
jgi:hypothetical protein